MTTLKDEIARLRELDAKRTPGKWIANGDELVTEFACPHCPPGSLNTTQEFIVNEMAGSREEDIAYLAAAPDMMAVIEQQSRMLDAAREALEYIRHRDSRWHDDDVATPALAFIDPDSELDPGPVETVVRLDEETEVTV